MSGKLDFASESLAAAKAEGTYVDPPVLESAVGGRIVVNGREVLNLASNNYLGLANHPELREAARAAVDRWGCGPAAVRTIAGTQRLHLEAEARFARFKGVEAAMLVQTGLCANQAAIPPLVGHDRETGERDVIFSDRLNHASIIDGARLSGAEIVIYDHCDVADLRAKIAERLPGRRRGLMVTDGVFSMDGDIAPLDAIADVCDEFGVMTMVDDAHGEGVLGKGRGIVAHFGLEGRFDVEIGTLSKAFGVMGGLIAGREEVVEYIRQKARPNLFSSALTPADTAACVAGADYIERHPELVEKLWENAAYLKAGLAEIGLEIGASQTPIAPVMLGEMSVAAEFSRRLLEKGVFTLAVGHPTVPEGAARIRVQNTAAHERADLDEALAVFGEVAREMGLAGKPTPAPAVAPPARLGARRPAPGEPPARLAFIREALAAAREGGGLIRIPTMDSPAGGRMVVNGQEVLNFCTNNYLGLANHPELKEATKRAIDRWGCGPASGRQLAGTMRLHLEAEERFARFKGVEAALLVQSGFCANQSALGPLVGRDKATGEQDVIFSDRLNHASIIDGARLSGAKIVVFEHCDPEDLRAKIEEHLPRYRRGLMVTDGVFSMDGDVAPLDKLTEVCDAYGVMTMVDDAHGEGVLGKGKGIVAQFGLEGRFDVEIGTLSKAFGVMGGIIAGKAEVVELIRRKARPNLFSSALTPSVTAACMAGADLIDRSPELVERLWANAEYFKKGIAALGLDTGRTETPIVPVILGEVPVAKEFSRKLFENGVFAMALGFPTVPRGTARIRVMNTAAHEREDLDRALEVFAKVAGEMGLLA